MFKLTVTNAEEVVFFGDIKYLVAPGVDGEMTILQNHIPIVSALREGKLRLSGDGDLEIDIKGGVLEFRNNSALVLLS